MFWKSYVKWQRCLRCKMEQHLYKTQSVAIVLIWHDISISMGKPAIMCQTNTSEKSSNTQTHEQMFRNIGEKICVCMINFRERDRKWTGKQCRWKAQDGKAIIWNDNSVLHQNALIGKNCSELNSNWKWWQWNKWKFRPEK